MVEVCWNDATEFCALAEPEGRTGLPAADGGGVGVLPAARGPRPCTSTATTRSDWLASATWPTHERRLGFRTGPTPSRLTTVSSSRAGGALRGECLGPVRYARQCMGVVSGQLRGGILQGLGGERSRGPSAASSRVFRGGGWGSAGRYCRSADRFRTRPGTGTAAWGSAWPGFRPSKGQASGAWSGVGRCREAERPAWTTEGRARRRIRRTAPRSGAGREIFNV